MAYLVIRNTLQIEILHYRDRIIEFVEGGNDKETIKKIVKEWRVSSYNNLDELGREFANYELWCDAEGFIDRIVIMPRECIYMFGVVFRGFSVYLKYHVNPWS